MATFQWKKILNLCVASPFFKLKNKICVGDTAELLTPGEIGKPFVVAELYDAEGCPIEAAPHPSQPFYVRVPYEVKEGDILRAGE